MKQHEFKFGDMVQHMGCGKYIFLGEWRDLVTNQPQGKALIINQSFKKRVVDMNYLTPIVSRDSERLDFIDDEAVTIRFESHFDGISENNYFRVSSELSSEFYYGKDIRQAIDNAMQQEQTK
ncbi:hypothetical protein [Wielerella bovis]|uniref:hypothetical protein n=1 Tax=Wielerella bovis TaxID=2917790 RepID=UPI00201A01FE|nr:hypothetical protein [Wielerella bovis]ULJ66625.1 hypothetical protein MIS31_10310 [Wielerella bovis]